MEVVDFGANGSPGGGRVFGGDSKKPTTPRPGTSGAGGCLQSGRSGSAWADGAAATPTRTDSAVAVSPAASLRRQLIRISPRCATRWWGR
jgi:hypothetical protein